MVRSATRKHWSEAGLLSSPVVCSKMLSKILAGEQIEASVGVRFALSTMAAAGLGNIVSDIAGLGFADIIEVILEGLLHSLLHRT